MPRFKLRRLKMLLSRKSSCRLKLKRRRYSWNLWTGVLWDEEKGGKHRQVGTGKREGGREAASFTTLPWGLRKQLTFCDATTGFLLKWRLRSERRVSAESLPRSGYCFWLVMLLVKFASTNQKHYPDLGNDTSSVWIFCTRFSDVR